MSTIVKLLARDALEGATAELTDRLTDGGALVTLLTVPSGSWLFKPGDPVEARAGEWEELQPTAVTEEDPEPDFFDPLDDVPEHEVFDAQTIQALNDVIEQQDAALARLEAQLAELNRARFAPGGAL